MREVVRLQRDAGIDFVNEGELTKGGARRLRCRAGRCPASSKRPTLCQKLPAGKILAPGVVTHSTPLIEHPELVAQRIQRFTKIVGPDVIASTDCGLGLRCHPQIAWAKLNALAEGAPTAGGF